MAQVIYVVGSLSGGYQEMFIAFRDLLDAERICEQWNEGKFDEECTPYYVPFSELLPENNEFNIVELPLINCDINDIENDTPLVLVDGPEVDGMITFAGCRLADPQDPAPFYLDDYRIYGEGLVNGFRGEEEEEEEQQ